MYLGKFVKGFLSAIAISGVANAGQTVDKFGFDQKKVRAAGSLVSMDWLDKNGNRITKDKPLTIMQNKSESFSLVAYRVGDPDLTFNLAMNVLDNDYNQVTDPVLSLLGVTSGSNACMFSKPQMSCPFKLLANESATVGTVRFAYFDSQDDTIIPSGGRDIEIAKYNPGGQIIGTGPSAETNVLTAMAVSDISTNDNEPFTVTVNNLESAVRVHLEYEIANPAIASFATSNPATHTCDEVVGTGVTEVKCTVDVTPLQTGNTIIKFIGKNFWVDTSNIQHDYEPTQLLPIKVNIGTLYAGYRNGKIFRKGSEYDLQTGNIGIKALAIDGENHRLYAIANNNLYQQDNFSNANLTLNLKATLPTVGIGVQRAQTLSLTNDPNTLLIGTGRNRVYSFTESDSTLLQLKVLKGSVISGETDTQSTKFNYFVDDRNNFWVRTESNVWIENSDYPTVKDLNNLHISAQYGDVYVAADIPPTDFSNDNGGSQLLRWEAGKLVKIDPLINPFKDGMYIVTLFSDGDNLFAGTNTGALYMFNKTTVQWSEIAQLPVSIITDIAVDKNRNIYLAASGDGVFKLKHTASAWVNTKLNAYSDKNIGVPTAVVIDNNLQ